MHTFTIKSLRYTDNFFPYYHSLYDLPGFVLLQSSDTTRGRYDIVSACPYDRLTLYRDSSSIEEVFSLLKARWSREASTSDLPFQGGGLGYLSYELGARLAGVPWKAAHPTNDGPLLDIGFYDWAIVVDHLKRTVSLVAQHKQSNTSAVVKEIEYRWEKSKQKKVSFAITTSFKPLLNRTVYGDVFNSIQNDIRRGRVYQVNYTQPFMAAYEGDPWAIYQRLTQYNPVPYAAFLKGDEGHVILSFSPEHFLKIENGSVITSPIKGTEKRFNDSALDRKAKAALKCSIKNQAENVMIVDLMRNDLGRVASPGTVRVTSLCEVQSFKAVHHLVSTIEAHYPSIMNPLDVLAAAFPGGSITGAPKREAMRVIAEQESWARGVYCGSIGYFSFHGRIDLNIAIRTLMVAENTLYLSAGGGLVMDSNEEEEYQECFTKIEAIIRGLM